MLSKIFYYAAFILLLAVFAANSIFGQNTTAATAVSPNKVDVLSGDYGAYRANNDLLYYHLDVRVDPAKKFLSGKNMIRFKMLKDDNRIQIDLYSALNVDKILYDNKELQYTRDTATRAVYIDFPRNSAKKSDLFD